jgi:hypothetical protein
MLGMSLKDKSEEEVIEIGKAQRAQSRRATRMVIFLWLAGLNLFLVAVVFHNVVR